MRGSDVNAVREQHRLRDGRFGSYTRGEAEDVDLVASDAAADAAARLAVVQAVVDALDDEHYDDANRNPKYCGEGSCALCAVLARLNGALSPDAGQRAAQERAEVFLCAKCGFGSVEHGMSGHPAFLCVAEMHLVPAAYYRAD